MHLIYLWHPLPSKLHIPWRLLAGLRIPRKCWLPVSCNKKWYRSSTEAYNIHSLRDRFRPLSPNNRLIVVLERFEKSECLLLCLIQTYTVLFFCFRILHYACLDILHTGKCIRRFGGIYAYCRYFIDRKW